MEELKILRDFLKPFAIATAEIEATKRPTLDSVHPWYAELEKHLQISRTDPEMIVHLKGIGHKYVTENIRNNMSPYHGIAVFLNPMLKSLIKFSDLEKKQIYDDAKELMGKFSPANNSNVENSRIDRREKRSATPEGMSSAMAAFYSDELDIDNEGDFDSISSELDEYKGVRVGGFEPSLKWWQRNKSRFPHLYTITRFILAIPANSAAPERVFSAAGKLVNFRPNLRSERVDDILFLKSNFDLFAKSKIVDAVDDDGNIAAVNDNEEEVLFDLAVGTNRVPDDDVFEFIDLLDD